MILSDGKAYGPQGYDYLCVPDSGKVLAVQRSTGEVSEAFTGTFPVGTVFQTPEQQEAQRRRNRQKQDFLEQKARLGTLGEFSFVSARQRFEGVSPETAARLVYLSTYLRTDTSEVLFSTQRTKMKRIDLPVVMGLSRKTADRFLDEASQEYIMLDDAGHLSMNPLLFRRGKIGRHGESLSWRKVYIDAVRKLYRAARGKHRYLGYVFQMLPYINIQHNILCHNIFEKDLHNLHQMTDKDFCREIGYDYSQIARLRKVYKGICFEVNGRMEAFCAFVDAGHGTRIYVNPHILYSGTRPDSVEVLGAFCTET